MFGARFLSFIVIFSCSLGGIGSASAESDSFYPEGLYGWYEAGPALVEEAEVRDFFNEPINGNPVAFDTGFHFGLGIGQQLTRFLKVEVESGLNYNSLKSIEDSTASSGNFYRVPIMGNVVLQFPNHTRFVPVIGAGVGAQWAVFDAQNISLGLTTIDEQSETWVFSYQGYAGVRYQFRENMSLGLIYHYFRPGTADFVQCQWVRRGDSLTIGRRDVSVTPNGDNTLYSDIILRRKGA